MRSQSDRLSLEADRRTPLSEFYGLALLGLIWVAFPPESEGPTVVVEYLRDIFQCLFFCVSGQGHDKRKGVSHGFAGHGRGKREYRLDSFFDFAFIRFSIHKVGLRGGFPPHLLIKY